MIYENLLTEELTLQTYTKNCETTAQRMYFHFKLTIWLALENRSNELLGFIGVETIIRPFLTRSIDY